MRHTPDIVLKRGILVLCAALGYLLLLPCWRRVREWARGPEYRVLTFHTVSPSRSEMTSVTPERFRKYLEILAQRALVLPLRQLAEGPCLRTSTRPLIALTFDDGYADNRTHAMPLLLERAFSATFFLTAGLIDTREFLPHDRAIGDKASHLMTWQDVRELADGGMEIGSHGLSHVRLYALPLDELQRELNESKACIERKLAQPVSSFAFPFGRAGDYDATALEAARKAGYKLIATARYGSNRLGNTTGLLRRIDVSASDNRWTVAAKVNGAMDLLGLLEATLIRRTLVRLRHMWTQLVPRQ